jgi:hypothetical protein
MMEVLIALVILAFLLGTAALRHGSERSRADSEAIALLMLAELKSARATAMSTGRPVAVCWPSKGLATCQSFFVLEGLSRGRVTRSRDFSREFRDGYLAVGCWGAASVGPADDGAREVDPASWLPANFADYAVIFDPQGRVATNDLPLQDGSYHIVACAAADTRPRQGLGRGVMGTPPVVFEISRVAAAHTITVKPSGAISMVSGAPGLTVDAHPFPMPAPAAPVAVTAPLFSPPRVQAVRLQAAPVLARTGTVTRSGSLNVEVTASDPSGDDLFIEWTAQKLSGGATSAGYFSQMGRQPMLWNVKTRIWESTVSWVPPDDAAVGDTFKLAFVLHNSAGSADSTGFAQISEIEVVDDHLLIASGSAGLYKMHKNGTGFELILPWDAIPWSVNVSPDGSKILWNHRLGANLDQAWVSNLDGSDARAICNISNATGDSRPVWNHTGTTIFFNTRSGIGVARADGTGLASLLPSPVAGDGRGIDISADGRYIAAEIWGDRSPGVRRRDLWIGKLNQSTYPPTVDYWTNLSAAPGGEMVGGYYTHLRFHRAPSSPNQPVVIVTGPSDGQVTYATYWAVSVNDTGTGFSGVFNQLQDERGRPIDDDVLSFSPDGTQAVGTNHIGNGVSLHDWSTSTGVPRLINRRQLLPSRPWIASIDWR